MYSYENYTNVKAEIEQRRLRAIAEADARAEELREQSEEIREIDAELSGTGMRLFKAALSGEDLAPLRARNEELQARRCEIIKSLGYPEDYSQIKYTCPTCSDTGYVKGTKLCKCLREELIKATIASSGIGHLIEKQSFENFDLGIYSSNEENYRKMKRSYDIAKKFVENFGKRHDNLLMSGKTGTGKTHLSTAIAREVIKKGYDVIYDTTQNIISDFESDRFKNAYSQAEPKADKYLECDLLIVDDLGTEFMTPFTISTIYNLVNTRQNRGLSTIISTNLSPKEISEKYEDRIYSRIVGKDYWVLEFAGPDMRTQH